MTMNLMMISVKKVFISSNSRIICLPCPLPRGRFLIQESAVGGLSYYIKKELHPLGTRFYPWYHPDSCSILLAAGTYLLRNVQVTFSLTYRLSPFQRNSLRGKFNPYLNRRRLPACDLLSLSENNSLLTRSLLFPKID